MVKATDLKSVSILERRFESYRLRRHQIMARRRLDLPCVDLLQIVFFERFDFHLSGFHGFINYYLIICKYIIMGVGIQTRFMLAR